MTWNGRRYSGDDPSGGRMDADGNEWFACDPYPTWYRRQGSKLITSGRDGITWASQVTTHETIVDRALTVEWQLEQLVAYLEHQGKRYGTSFTNGLNHELARLRIEWRI